VSDPATAAAADNNNCPTRPTSPKPALPLPHAAGWVPAIATVATAATATKKARAGADIARASSPQCNLKQCQFDICIGGYFRDSVKTSGFFWANKIGGQEGKQ
jgi:hypothetical protein